MESRRRTRYLGSFRRSSRPLTPEQASLAAIGYPIAMRAVRRERWKSSGLGDDLMNDWAISTLISAVRRYREDSGVPFAAYLRYRIKLELIRVRKDASRGEKTVALGRCNPAVEHDWPDDSIEDLVSPLNGREREVLALRYRGLDDAGIARRIGLSVSGVRMVCDLGLDYLRYFHGTPAGRPA